MKKKILFLICIAVFCITLAIVGSATTYYTDGTTEYLECEIADTYHIDSYIIKNGGFPKTDADGDALTWYLVSTETNSETGNITKTVASVKTKDYISGTKFLEPLTKFNVVSVNFENDVTEIPIFGEMDGAQGKEILFIYIPDGVTSLPFRFCQLTPVIKCEFTENSQCETWVGLTFWGAKSLREIVIPPQLTAFPTKDGGAFDGCSRLEKLAFAQNAEITYIEGWYFEDTAIKEMILPDSITTITQRLFQGMRKLEYVRFGKYVNAISNTVNGDFSLFHDCVNLKTVVIPGTLLAENIGANGNKLTYGFSTASPTFIYTGTIEEFEKIQAVFKGYSNNGSLTGATVENGRIVIANHCEVYYDSAHSCDSNCETADACTRNCGYVASKSEGHNIETGLLYPNGFSACGTRYTDCTNDSCTILDKTETTAPVFGTSGGYSTNGTGISGGWTVDIALLREYNEKYPDSKIKYGMIILNPEYITGNTFLDSNKQINIGEGGMGGLQIEMISEEYSNFSASITGFTGYEDLELIICAYAYEQGSDFVEFIQDTSSQAYVSTVEKSDATLKTVTFEKVVSLNSIETLDAILPTNKEN